MLKVFTSGAISSIICDLHVIDVQFTWEVLLKFLINFSIGGILCVVW